MGRKSKTREILLAVLEKTTDTGIALYDFASNTHHYVYGSPNLERYNLYHLVGRLRSEGMIEGIKNEGKILLKLTEKGKYYLEIERRLKKNQWDGLWRVVIFDIPEKHKKVRSVLRRRLKEWGFKFWQKSVWISKKDITEPMRKFVKDLGIEKFVLVMVCSDIGSDHINNDR